MKHELVTSKHPVFRCSNILQKGAFKKRKKEEELEGTSKKRARKPSHAREDKMVLACILFEVKAWIRNKMPVHIRTSIQELKQEEVTVIAHTNQQFVQWKNMCATTTSRFAQWVTTCSAAILRFVPWNLSRGRISILPNKTSMKRLGRLLHEISGVL